MFTTGSNSRPRSGTDCALTERVTTRFSSDELEKLRAKAKSVGKTESEFIRESVKNRVERYARRPMHDAVVADYCLGVRVKHAVEVLRLALEPLAEHGVFSAHGAVAIELIQKEIGALEASLPPVAQYVDIPNGLDFEYPPFEEMH